MVLILYCLYLHCYICLFIIFFFFKQKTAYEMRISDWSSDVCSSDLFGALVGAMFWNVVTWLKGIPSSSSHALVGGIVGAGVAHAGFEGIQWTGLNKTVIAIFLSPMLGMLLAMLVMLRSEEHTSELQSLMRISYAVFCFKKKNNNTTK